MLRSRLGVVSLVPAGTLAGHATAYALAGGDAHLHGAHGYLGFVLAVAGPVALAALVWHAWQGALAARGPRLGLLFLAQPAMFLVQEGVEHTLAGHGLASVAHSPAVRVGVVAQLAVAAVSALLVGAARAAGRAVAGLRRRARLWRVREAVRPPVSVTPGCRSRKGTPWSERGPPGLLAPA